MTAERAGSIQRRVREVTASFGKIALLVDDAPDAASRAARELYAAEELPSWWLLARSAECGAAAVDALADLYGDAAASSTVRGLVLVDRFLPAHDDQEWATAWDAPKLGLSPGEREIYEAMDRAVRRLLLLARQRGESCPFACELITSYPHVPFEPTAGRTGEDPLPWQRRSIEVLFQLRQKPGFPYSLLSYGPEPSRQNGGGGAPGATRRFTRQGEEAWKARVWRPTVEGLAKALAQDDPAVPIVLFTGAGASLAPGSYGSGMPPTWWLLEEASRSLVHDRAEGKVRPTGRLEKPHGATPDRDRWPCCHAADGDGPERRQKVSFPREQGTAAIDWLVSHLLASDKHRASDLQLGLDLIFSPEWNQGSHWSIPRFYQYFRSHLERFDHGFPYHHWLLAQMPWTRIITTNFDNFHERAAFAAAASIDSDPEIRHRHLPLGCVFPQTGSKLSNAKFADLARTHRLFKPYGNLLSPEELVLGDTPTTAAGNGAPIDFGGRLRQSFRGLETARRGWLVVVGHSMKDRYIGDALEDLAILKSFELLWVIPDAYRRCAPREAEDMPHRSRWEERMFRVLDRRENAATGGEPGLLSGPLPGTALELAYDLWREYQRNVAARAGG